ncbi:CBS domain-containing protein [Halomicrobium zhouii]|uniref:CBS domain-containing protein n=1 Tax=Halomicrobium zhouii TaxID=767519 RepID=A0A1I6LJ06_9EURY|nr:CBS domain-containing protein [Halomicrobium zhouii]SFS03312.1 CBS domain-containing protein [Halomicrobium zhouii]
MTLRSIARPLDQVVTASRDTPVREIARYMEEQAVGSVVVVDEDEPVGIVTDRDLTLSAINRDMPLDTPVRKVMEHDVVTADADAGVAEACRKMKRHRVRRLPVVDDDALVGFVSADDLLLLLVEELDCLATIVRYESPPH